MIRRLAALVAAAVLAVGVAAAPAHADDEIGLSRDGLTWVPALTTPLYEAGFTWVPGDVEERSFRVRNDGPSAGELLVDVVASDPQALLASPDFLLEARVGSGPWVEVAPGTTRLQPAVLDVPRGADTSVTVRGTFRAETTGHMDEIAPFDVRVTLSEDGDIGGEEDEGGGDDGDDGEVAGGALPDTGGRFGVGVLWLAAGLIGAGIALVRPGRTRREEVARG
ncbi:hypothetical protein [Pimelobacter simplex]|uniref:hypothetical protein n=1 Tax=Nocardioides simplex TaxID=2045 RepID=UPI001933264A|nr:hypothetical protein [Pimelobacter simplex]